MVDTTQFPTLSQSLSGPTPDQLAAARQYHVANEVAARNTAAQPGAFMGGVSEGWHGLLGDIGSLGGAIGSVTGNQWMQDQGKAIVSQQQALADKYGRPDLRAAPWSAQGGGWSEVPGWLERGAGAMLPSLAAMVGGAAIGGPIGVAASGGKYVEGALDAAGIAGRAIGSTVGGMGAMYPSAVGSMAAPMQEQGTITPAKAGAALALGVPMAAVQSLTPGGLLAHAAGTGPLSFLAHEVVGTPIQRAIKGGVQQAALGAVQGGVTTAVSDAFDPNMSASDRMQRVVDATAGAAVMGGVMGGALGAVHAGSGNEELKRATDPAFTDPKNFPARQTDDIQKQLSEVNARIQSGKTYPRDISLQASLQAELASSRRNPSPPEPTSSFGPMAGPPSPPQADSTGQLTLPGLQQVGMLRPLADRPTAELQGQLTRIEARGRDGQPLPQDMPMHTMLVQELSRPERMQYGDILSEHAELESRKASLGNDEDARRQLLADALQTKADPTQGPQGPQLDLGTVNEDAAATAKQEQDAAQRVTDSQKEVQDLAGKKPPKDVKAFASELTAQDRPGIVTALREYFSNPEVDPSDKMLKIGEHYGVLDADGKPKNADGLRKEIADLSVQYDAKVKAVSDLRQTDASPKELKQALAEATAFRNTEISPKEALLRDHLEADRRQTEFGDSLAKMPQTDAVSTLRQLFVDPSKVWPSGAEEQGKKYGVLDENGKYKNTAGLQKDLLGAHQTYDALKAGDPEAAAKYLTDTLDPLRKLVADHQSVDQKEAASALQERGATGADVGNDAQARAGVSGGNTQGDATTAARQGEEGTAKTPEEDAYDIIEHGLLWNTDINGNRSVTANIGAPPRGQTPYDAVNQVDWNTYAHMRGQLLSGVTGRAQVPYAVRSVDGQIRPSYLEVGNWEGARFEENSYPRPLVRRTPWLSANVMPKAPQEVDTIRGQLEAIRDSKSNEDMQAYGPKMKQQAISALDALSKGNAKPAYDILNSEAMYRVIGDGGAVVRGKQVADAVIGNKTKSEVPTPTTSAAEASAQAVAAQPMGRDAFDKMFIKATAKLGENGSTFQAVDTPAELPQVIKDDLLAQGIDPAGIRGAMMQNTDGTISRYIIRSAIRNPTELQGVVAHEAMHGQYGDDVLLRAFDKLDGIDGLRKIANDKGFAKEFEKYIPDGPMNDRMKMDLVDELLSMIAERKNERNVNGFIQRWAGTIKEAFVSGLRMAGLNAFADKVNSNDFTNVGAAKLLRDMRGIDPGVSPTDYRARVAYSKTPAFPDDISRDVIGEALSMKQWVIDHGFGPKNVTNRIQKLKLGWSTFDTLPKEYGHYFPSLSTIWDAISKKDIMGIRLVSPAKAAIADANTFSLDKKSGNLLRQVLAYTGVSIDPRKSYEQQPWLHGKPNSGDLKSLAVEAHQTWNQLGQKGGQDLFNRLETAGQFQQYTRNAMLLHSLMTADYGHEGPHPVDTYMGETGIHHDTAAATAYMKAQQDALLKTAVQLSGERTAQQPAPKSGEVVPTDPLKALIGMVNDNNARMAQSPYFPMGRTGDWYVAAKIARDALGATRADAVTGIRKLLDDNGFHNIDMNQGSQSNQFYTRLKNPDQMDALNKVILQARDAGYLDDKTPDGDYGLARGSIRQGEMLKTIAPSWMQKIVERMDAATNMPQEYKDTMRELWLDMLPDNSLAKSYQPREGVHGFDADMIKNMSDHNMTFANAIAGQVTSGRIQPALARMSQELRDIQKDNTGKYTSQDIVTAKNVLNEVEMRQVKMPWRVKNDVYSFLNAANHTYYLGLSPGYMLEVVGQIPTLLWPTLSQKYGYARAASAIFRAAPEAFKIMRSIATSKNALEGEVLADVLKSNNVSDKTIAKLMDATARGDLFMGGFTQAASLPTGGVEPGYHKALRLSNATAVYAELFSRVLSTLSSHDLVERGERANTLSAGDYAHEVTSKSMMDWGTGNSPRYTGQGGIAGPLSPVMFKFMGFQIRMLQTLYRDVHTWAGTDSALKYASPAERAQAKAEAGRFLTAHLAATTVLAGTMGLPAASWLAGATTKLTGNAPSSLNPTGEAYDVQEHYRAFLAHMFGKELGEVLAHGVPRALGVDTSNLGDSQLIPFAKYLNDRRKMEDAIPANPMQMFGSPVSMVTSFVKGVRDIGTGNLLQGLKEMSPSTLKSGIEAYRMTNEGYVDTSGHKLPLTPNMRDIIAQAVGFTPSTKEEYEESTRAMTGRVEELQFRSGVLKRNFMMAMQEGDVAKQQAALDAIKQHDLAAPQLAILPQLESYARGWMQAPVMARATGQPMGANMRDYLAAQTRSAAYNWPHP